MSKVYIRIDKTTSPVKRELACDGRTIAELSYHDALYLALQIISSLREDVRG